MTCRMRERKYALRLRLLPCRRRSTCGWPNQKLLMFEMLKDIFVRFCEFLRDICERLFIFWHGLRFGCWFAGLAAGWERGFTTETGHALHFYRSYGALWGLLIEPTWGCRQPTGLLQSLGPVHTATLGIHETVDCQPTAPNSPLQWAQ